MKHHENKPRRNWPRVLNTVSVAKALLLVGLFNFFASGTTENFKVDHYDREHENGRFPFLMPNVKLNGTELYLCTAVKVDFEQNFYIVGFEPNATMHTPVHHMAITSCEVPGSTKPVWNCGKKSTRKAEKSSDVELEEATVCGGGTHSEILYAWTRGVANFALPAGVGFEVGKDSPIKYMVLQVHYVNISKFADGSSDQSGIFINYTTKPLNKFAGELMLGTAGYIPPMSTEHMEAACQITEHKILHPFAYRIHTHTLGKVVSVYRVRANERAEHQWTLLGKGDPMEPQMYYPVENTEPIVFGDIMAVRCTMISTRNRTTNTGSTKEDEMCNVYFMYYVENDQPLNMKFCSSEGPPNYYWKNPDTGLNNIPNFEASQL